MNTFTIKFYPDQDRAQLFGPRKGTDTQLLCLACWRFNPSLGVYVIRYTDYKDAHESHASETSTDIQDAAAVRVLVGLELLARMNALVR